MKNEWIKPHEAVVLGNRPRINGFYSGGTKDYGNIVDAYQPVLSTNKQEEQYEMLDKMGNVVYMTRQEFEEHNIFRHLLNSMKYYYTNDSVNKFAKKYVVVSKYLHLLLEINIKKKSPLLEGQSMNVA